MLTAIAEKINRSKKNYHCEISGCGFRIEGIIFKTLLETNDHNWVLDGVEYLFEPIEVVLKESEINNVDLSNKEYFCRIEINGGVFININTI